MSKKCEFKSAEELGLEQKEWEALIKTLTLMEAGVILHHTKRTKDPKEGDIFFDMSEWHRTNLVVFGKQRKECGSVCCIGGSAEFIGKLGIDALSERADELYHVGNKELSNLFYKWTGDPTPAQAAKVLRGYLETGKTNWGRAYNKPHEK